MTRARSVTKMPLDRWAEIIGISPMHFSGAVVPGVWEYEDHTCNDVWYQHPWQSPEIASREHIAQLLVTAIDDIERFLGYYVSPTYTEETLNYPIIPKFIMGKRRLINFGQYKKITVATTVDATLYDLDGDDYKETAINMFSFTGDLSTLRFYTGGKIFDETYRLYPKSVTRVDDMVTVKFNSWSLFQPSLWEQPPALVGIIDGSAEENYNLSMDIASIAIDPTLPQAEIIWTKNNFCGCGGAGCPACTIATQPACVDIIDAKLGYVSVSPVKWDETGEQFVHAAYVYHHKPARIKFYYTSGLSTTPLPVEEAIAWLAGARLRFRACACSGVKETLDDLTRDLIEVNKARQIYISILTPDMVTNIFGTRYGEFQAYKRINTWEMNGDHGGII